MKSMGFGKKRSNKVGVGAITTNKKKLFAEGGMMDDGKDVDPVSGNDVPMGSLAEEVRDDVDAKLSPGEFVFPADVVRFIGLERLMQMRDQAKKGLMRMNDIGQMGNAEEAGEKADDTYEEGEEDDDKFESDIDEIMKEVDKEETGRQTEMAFNTGGFVNQSYYDLTKAPKNPALDIRYFKDSAGKDFYMPFINGKPMKPMPNGATPIGMPTGTTTTDDDEKEGGATGGAGGGFAGGSSVVGGGITGGLTNKTDTTTTTSKTVGETWGTQDVYGTYTGENLADFGRADMIYNPGGSGPAGEVMGEDLWNSSISNANVKLGTTVLSAIASTMGVPGILTLPFRLAVNKFGADKVNAYLGEVNRETMGRASGVDTSTPEGIASAASQIDQVIYKDDVRAQAPAASGAIGTGGIAANASNAVSDALRNTGLSDDQIGSFAQRAADAVVRGTDINTAINDAKNAAVDAIYQNQLAFGGADLTRVEIANSLFGTTPTVEVSDPFEFTSDDALFGDFWGTMDEEEKSSDEEDEEGLGFGSYMGSSSPIIDIKEMLKRQQSQER
jgi:hypothetical protein